ncbi:hypothetical protein EC957_011134 [Mortierella hygrophila]|uniref:Yeast cell wall synthesis Kre9/Knh1-like N-terminal domain-containing protein n=1 Tax=Mortierella hygrophila TaxID=979708 RepID=A0A9P6F9T3_9FUNG|nr:hypothetical protein EC957_011134 [Mortierella hygrophila]
MKITTLSAVLLLASATVLADKKSTVSSLNTAASIADKRDARHHEVNGASVVKRAADGPKGVNRHEHQEKKGGKKHNEHGVEAHSDGGNRYHDKDDEEKEVKGGGNDKEKGEKKEKKGGKGDEKNGGGGKKEGEEMGVKDSRDKKGVEGEKGPEGEKGAEGEKKGAEGDKKGGADDKGDAADKTGGNKDASEKGGEKDVATGGDAATPAVDGGEGKEGGAADPSVPRDYSSPLWLVQPFGSSVWAQGETYVISWGPNPDPVHAKALTPKALVDIRLMQGPPDNLKEIAVLSNGVDSSLHKYEWLVPTTVTPATDYSIRISHASDVDTYSHYFEVVKAGDSRSNKSNVGEPLQMPQKGGVPQPLNKGPTKPALPPNPFPAAPAASSKPVSPPAVAKPVVHASSAHSETHQGANMLAFAMTLFGAVYFL